MDEENWTIPPLFRLVLATLKDTDIRIFVKINARHGNMFFSFQKQLRISPPTAVQLRLSLSIYFPRSNTEKIVYILGQLEQENKYRE